LNLSGYHPSDALTIASVAASTDRRTGSTSNGEQIAVAAISRWPMLLPFTGNDAHSAFCHKQISRFFARSVSPCPASHHSNSYICKPNRRNPFDTRSPRAFRNGRRLAGTDYFSLEWLWPWPLLVSQLGRFS
jgi:hypothetical protein